MTPITRVWLAFAAMGAALIHLAVGASAPVPLAIALVGLGAAELGWGVATMVRGRLIASQATVLAALVPLFVWAATATLGAGFGLPARAANLPLFPMATASLFDLVLAGGLALVQRRAGNRSTATEAAGTVQGWRFLTAVIVGGALVSALTTPALAATDAGRNADPHGSHSIPGLEFLDGGHAGH